jgi:hypothetical protein
MFLFYIWVIIFIILSIIILFTNLFFIGYNYYKIIINRPDYDKFLNFLDNGHLIYTFYPVSIIIWIIPSIDRIYHFIFKDNMLWLEILRTICLQSGGIVNLFYYILSIIIYPLVNKLIYSCLRKKSNEKIFK